MAYPFRETIDFFSRCPCVIQHSGYHQPCKLGHVRFDVSQRAQLSLRSNVTAAAAHGSLS